MISSAKIGYSINVLVNDSNSSSHWSKSQVTQDLVFFSESKCTGTGNSSKYISISGFAGMGAKEAAHSKQGRLIEKNTMGLTSKELWLHINEKVTDNSMKYKGNIESYMPTVLYCTSDLYYRGNGMTAKNLYINGKDKILTNYEGSSLSKSVKYGGISNESNIEVVVTPEYTIENAYENRTVALRINSASNRYTGLGYSSGDDLIEQAYRGDFKMDAKILKGQKFVILRDLLNETDWLPCVCDNTQKPNDFDEFIEHDGM